jgi:ribosomal protein S27E
MTSSPDDGVFVRVGCPSCGRDDIFLKCDQCGRQSLFALSAEGVACSCGATYGHALCSCGEQVGPEHLVAVPFEEGPLVASEVELDPKRLVALGALVVAVLGAVGWWALA